MPRPRGQNLNKACTYVWEEKLKTYEAWDRAVGQRVEESPENSSTANLASGATFTGTAVNALGVNSTQVMLKCDQNCTVYVDQSGDGTNWDLMDSFNYWATTDNFGITVQMIGSYVRVRVKNTGLAASTVFRLFTVLCPFAEPLPRALDKEGHEPVHIYGLTDKYNFNAENTTQGELRTTTTTKLVGEMFVGTTIDPNIWTVATGTAGSVTQTGGTLILQTGTTANNGVSAQTVHIGRYLGATSIKFRTLFQLGDTGTANNTRKWGVFTTTDGAYFELQGATFNLVTRKGSVDTRVANGTFNGQAGGIYTLDTAVHTYEIYWTNKYVYYMIDGNLIHTVTATSDTWADTMSFPIRFENQNSNGNTTNLVMKVRVATISRLGNLDHQPMSKYIAGITAGNVLKYGPGKIRGVVISAVINNSVITLYDNTAASGVVIWTSGPMSNNTTPFSLDLFGVQFSTGLTAVISGANCDVLVAYE